MKTIILLIIFFSYSIFSLPVAVIHGFYDSCENSFFSTLIKVLKYNVYDFAVCLKTGEGSDSLSLSFEEQCQKACEEIKKYPQFKNDFSILSISQGGLIARYLIQKCNMEGNVKKLVSLGGPMMGTSKVPFCLEGVVCFIINSLVDYFVYNKNIQNSVGPAGYYRTAGHIDDFKKSNSILYKLNNPSEKEKNKFKNLTNLVLIGFDDDKMISPKETAEFGIFDENYNVIKMRETDEYKNDVIGLKYLDENGRVKIVYLKGGHLNFDFDDILKYVVNDL